MMKWFVGLLITGAAMAGDEPPLEHFAEGYRLEIDGSAAIYRLPLPVEAYRTVVRRDLGDIRVFNSDGERVPHAVRRPQTAEERKTVAVELPFFPISSEVDDLGSSGELDVMVADDGTIVRITSKDGAMVAENAVVHDYIIDLSGLNRGVDELEFELAGTDNSYIRSASLQHSDDLNTWRSLVDNATLARLDYGGHSLDSHTIKLPNRRLDYLRFHWLEDPGGLQIRRVRARLNSVPGSVDRTWSEVDGRRSEENKEAFLFDTKGLFPVDRVNIVLPEDNTLIEAALSSRMDEKSDWRRRYTGLFYNLQVNGNRLQSGSVNVPSSADRYWRLQVKTRGGMGSRIPKLQFAWIPNHLYFLARGAGPFTLAFGNGQVGAPGRPIDALMNVLGEEKASGLVGEAKLAEAVSLMGERARAHELVIPWQRILLWTVLIAGVLVIGTMAWRLLRQLNNGE